MRRFLQFFTKIILDFSSLVVLAIFISFMIGYSGKIVFDSDRIIRVKELGRFLKERGVQDFRLIDSEYKLYDRSLIELLLNEYCIDVVMRQRYIPEVHDCDDYALFVLYHIRHKLNQSACFFGTVDSHAVIYCLDKDLKPIIYDSTGCSFLRSNVTVSFLFG